MSFNLENSQALWDAFPTGCFECAGTMTVGGAQTIRHDNLVYWFWPTTGILARSGHPEFEKAKREFDLLPDLKDETTFACVLRALAKRIQFDSSRGVLWKPYAQVSRNTSGKTTAGWTLKTISREATFMMEGITDMHEALVQATTMTNCACGRGSRRDCPQHGESKSRVWR